MNTEKENINEFMKNEKVKEWMKRYQDGWMNEWMLSMKYHV